MILLKLGVPVKDKATGLKGMLTHSQIGSDMNAYYLFQPRGINPEEGTPVKAFWISFDRVDGGIEIDIDIPTNMLGSEVTDKASGYSGTVTHLTLHPNRCVHALVQSKGRLQKNGQAIEPVDFDARRLVGKEVPEFTDEEIEKSEKKFPSPTSVTRYIPRT